MQRSIQELLVAALATAVAVALGVFTALPAARAQGNAAIETEVVTIDPLTGTPQAVVDDTR